MAAVTTPMTKRCRLSMNEEAEATSSCASRLQFFVRMFPNGNSIVMQASAEETVKSIHTRIESRVGIPVQYQRLIHSGKQLHLMQSLGECGIENDATLQLVAHLPSEVDSSGQQDVVVGDMVNLLWRIYIGKPETSSGISDYDTVQHLMRKHFKVKAFIAFESLMAPELLVMLYHSKSPVHKGIADYAIRLFLDGCCSLFNKGLYLCCLRTVVKFCSLLREDKGDDCELYNLFQNSLNNMLKECVGNRNPNREVLLKGIFDHVRELVNGLLSDLDFSININVPLVSNFQSLIAFLIPIMHAIRVTGIQAWEARSGADEEEPSLAKEISKLRLMYIRLLHKMDAVFEEIEDYVDKKTQWNAGWYKYIPILKQMSQFSKLIDDGEEILRAVLKRRWRAMSELTTSYVERDDEDYEWILEHKSVLDSKARRHIALMLFPSEKHEDKETEDISIDRSNLLVESFHNTVRKRPEAMRAGLSIKFLNEEGEGVGVEREWLLLVCQEIFNPLNALFVPCPNDRRRFFPNPASNVNPLHLDYFTFSGRMIALALMIDLRVGIAFDRVFFKQLAGGCITLEDIQEADPDLYKSCKQILEMDVELVDSDALGLRFAREVEELGHMKVIELCPGGESIVVNSRNREKYIDLLIQNKFLTSISEQVSHFAKGFGDIIFDSKLRQFFQILDLEDFDMMLYGTENAISVEDWKAHTEYFGYEETDPQISWFWEVVRRMSAEQRKALLFFWTSIKYLPVEGFSYMDSKLLICRATEPDLLPSSGTCSYRLSLPCYSSMAVMENRLGIITQEYISSSFGFY